MNIGTSITQLNSHLKREELLVYFSQQKSLADNWAHCISKQILKWLGQRAKNFLLDLSAAILYKKLFHCHWIEKYLLTPYLYYYIHLFKENYNVNERFILQCSILANIRTYTGVRIIRKTIIDVLMHVFASKLDLYAWIKTMMMFVRIISHLKRKLTKTKAVVYKLLLN